MKAAQTRRDFLSALLLVSAGSARRGAAELGRTGSAEWRRTVRTAVRIVAGLVANSASGSAAAHRTTCGGTATANRSGPITSHRGSAGSAQCRGTSRSAVGAASLCKRESARQRESRCQ